MIIEINSCGDCPFMNWDSELGRDMCNLSYHLKKNIKLKFREELPRDKRHDECPLTDKMIFKPI